MIIISEVVHNGEVHFQVNSCFVSMFAFLHPDEKIVIRAEKDHIKALKANVKDVDINNIEFLSYDRYYDAKKYNWGFRIIGECIQIIKTLFTGRSHDDSIYVWTCLFPTGHLFLNVLTYFQKKKKHVIILHGELEFLKTENKKISEILFGFILKIALNISTKKNKYIVLGDNIKNNLNNLVSKRVLDKIFSILHPYNFSVDQNIQCLSTNASDLTIGAIGTQMLSKNSQLIFQLAERFKTNILAHEITFKTIGKVLPELNCYKTDLVNNLFADTFVYQEQFETEISRLNFVVFFYDNSAYQLCASGAIFEAIRMGIPVISIENDFFRWLFDSYGELGFLCKDIDAIQIVINGLKQENYNEKVEVFKNNIANFKIQNDLKNLAFNLKYII